MPDHVDGAIVVLCGSKDTAKSNSIANKALGRFGGRMSDEELKVGGPEKEATRNHERRVVSSMNLSSQIVEMRQGIEEMIESGPLSEVTPDARKQARQVAMIGVAQAMWCVSDQLSQIKSSEKPVNTVLERALQEAEKIAGDLWVEGL
ncbi:MAG: hypothetical protein EOO38_25680 [Cytophagaceae bacterium]|nr:MAG: hypothetical protein EOO38_25680 [Cytophagaceae bacterium]